MNVTPFMRGLSKGKAKSKKNNKTQDKYSSPESNKKWKNHNKTSSHISKNRTALSVPGFKPKPRKYKRSKEIKDHSTIKLTKNPNN